MGFLSRAQTPKRMRTTSAAMALLSFVDADSGSKRLEERVEAHRIRCNLSRQIDPVTGNRMFESKEAVPWEEVDKVLRERQQAALTPPPVPPSPPLDWLASS